MRIFGLIGKNLDHSGSQAYFRQRFREENIIDCDYRNFPMQRIDDLKDLVKKDPQISGLNITIPYKIEVLDLLDEMDESAWKTGAANCVSVIRQGPEIKMKGYNTDVFAFYQTLAPHLQEQHKKALVLGAGGASRAVVYALNALGIEVKVASRSAKQGQLGMEGITQELIAECKLIINATPLGMYPDTGSFPDIPYHALSSRHLLYDLVYNPQETVFLTRGKKMGVAVINGLSMLKLQADISWKIWKISCLIPAFLLLW